MSVINIQLLPITQQNTHRGNNDMTDRQTDQQTDRPGHWVVGKCKHRFFSMVAFLRY